MSKPHANLRTSAVLAGALFSASLLGACGKLPGNTGGEAVLRAVKRPQAEATTYPSIVPGASTAPSTAPTASEAPIGYTGNHVVVSGSVFNIGGGAMTGVTVTARSLSADAPYEATVTTDEGSFVLNGVPEGVNIELVASKEGWTARRRVATFQGQVSFRHEIAFGSPNGQNQGGEAFFLSPFPEILAVEPAIEADGIDPNGGRYTLHLSESLGAEDRRRLEAAFRLLPANDLANGGVVGTTTDLAVATAGDYPHLITVDGNAAVAPYDLRKGSLFHNEPDTRATWTWSQDGLSATLSFPAPLLASADDAAKYQIALVSAGSGAVIRDRDGNQLGTDGLGSLGDYPARGDLILGAFVRPDLALGTVGGLTAGSARERWAATHRSVATFSVKQDTLAPRLLNLVAGPQGSDTRIALRFSEPLVAFDGTAGGFVGNRVLDDASDLENYVFALAASADEVNAVELSDKGGLLVDPRATAQLTSDQHDRAWHFDPAAFVSTRTGAAVGSVLVEVDAFDPTRVVISVLGRPDFFDSAAGHLKARARIDDPAGNTTGVRQANENTPVASL